MTRNISKFGLLLLTVVITLTCSSPLVPVLGTVVLDFSSGSRAVGIPAGLTTFNVEVKAPDMATITVRLTAPDLSTVIELPSGADRQFYVTAADSAGKIRYQGKAQLEVVPGATHDLDITMSPVFRVNYLATGAGSGLAPVDAGLYSAGDSATVLGNSGNLTKAGYTFAGWNTAEDGSGTAYAVGSTVSLVDADINLYPRWIPVPYSISYVLNGGVNATGNPATYTIEDTEITLLPPEPWSPYTFLGWYTDTNYITKVISIPTGSTGNRTLYALWDTPTYIVSYDAQGGTTATPPTTSVTYGQIYGALATTSRVGYSFSGWFTEPLGAGTQIFETTTVTITANQTLYAHWVEETYTISYVLNGAPDNGGNPSSYTVSSNITLTAPSWAPYIFEGWYTDIAYTFAKNEILPGETGDITLYAQWAAPTYIVSYDAQGGTTATPPTTSVTYGQTYGTLATTSRVGYSFVGWFTETLGAGTQIFETTTVTITANQTLYAHWVEETYTISYVLNGSPDNGGNPSSYTVSSNITLTAPSWAPYIFEGWYTDAGFTVAKTQILPGETGDITLYAQWAAPTYIVSYDAQGGTTATPPTTNVTYGQTYGTLATTSRVGYSFVGWFTETLGAGTQIFDTTTVTITANQTLFAFWMPLGVPPAAPATLGFTQPAAGTIQVTWVDNATTEDGFRIFRDSVEIASLGPDVTSYLDSGLIAGTSYSYEVEAYNAFGSSTRATAAPKTPVGLPTLDKPAPASANLSLRPSLSWFSVPGATSYDLLVTDGGVPVIDLPGLGATTHMPALGVLAIDTTYEWQVTARNSDFQLLSGIRSFTTRGPNLYIDIASGVDITDRGNTQTLPLASFSYALAELARPGDTLHATGGLYAESLPIISQDLVIMGSYTDTSYNPGARALPATTILTDISGSQVSSLRMTGGTVNLDRVEVRSPDIAASNLTALHFSGGTLLVKDSILSVPAPVSSGGSINGLQFAGAGSVTIEGSTISLAGTVTGTGNALGIIVQPVAAILTIQGSSFNTSSLTAESLNWIQLVAGASVRTIIVQDNSFSGTISTGAAASSVFRLGGLSSQTDITLEYNTIQGVANNNGISYGIWMEGASKTVTIGGNSFMMDQSVSGNLVAIDLASAAGSTRPVIYGNRLRLPGRTGAGSSTGIRINGTEGALVANNVIEVFGAGDLASYGIITYSPTTDIIHNTVVFASSFTHTGLSYPISTMVGTTTSIVANNLVISYPAAMHVGFNNPAGAANVSTYNNVFHGTSDDMVTMNTPANADLNQLIADPVLTPGTFPNIDWYAPTATSPLGIREGGSASYLVAVPDDINGTARTAPLSVGAYEW